MSAGKCCDRKWVPVIITFLLLKYCYYCRFHFKQEFGLEGLLFWYPKLQQHQAAASIISYLSLQWLLFMLKIMQWVHVKCMAPVCRVCGALYICAADPIHKLFLIMTTGLLGLFLVIPQRDQLLFSLSTALDLKQTHFDTGRMGTDWWMYGCCMGVGIYVRGWVGYVCLCVLHSAYVRVCVCVCEIRLLHLCASIMAWE